MYLEVVLLDDSIWPYRVHEPAFRHNGAFGTVQDSQDVERPRAYVHCRSIALYVAALEVDVQFADPDHAVLTPSLLRQAAKRPAVIRYDPAEDTQGR